MYKIAAGVIGAALMLIYVAPVVLKLGEPALAVVCTIGLAMMFVDLWQSLRSKNDE